MSVIKLFRRPKAAPEEPSDTALLALFERDPEAAWDLFIDRYSGLMLATLHHLGFDHDGVMDRFVYLCEKLSENQFRRLRSVRFAGQRGDLEPWLRTVVKHLSVSWAWSVHGRRRLFKSIRRLSGRHQRIFELYFWGGLTPSQVREQLSVEEHGEIDLLVVLDALEHIFGNLDSHQTWRLMSQLMRYRETVPIADMDTATPIVFEPRDGKADPEHALLRRERQRSIESALASLEPRQRLVLQLRYDDALPLAEVATLLGLSLSAVKMSIRQGLDRLRAVLREQDEEGSTPCPA